MQVVMLSRGMTSCGEEGRGRLSEASAEGEGEGEVVGLVDAED
jgi:hypothetical protein